MSVHLSLVWSWSLPLCDCEQDDVRNGLDGCGAHLCVGGHIDGQAAGGERGGKSGPPKGDLVTTVDGKDIESIPMLQETVLLLDTVGNSNARGPAAFSCSLLLTVPASLVSSPLAAYFVHWGVGTPNATANPRLARTGLAPSVQPP